MFTNNISVLVSNVIYCRLMLCIMLCIEAMSELQNFHYCKYLFGLVRVRTARLVRFVPNNFKVWVRFANN